MKTVTNLSQPGLVQALAHPLRVQILGILQERRASPRELSDELGAPLGTVSYHVRRLADLKLIKLVKKTPRRGAIEHHYEARAAPAVSDTTWAGTPAVVKKAMVGSTLDNIGRLATDAAGAGGFDSSKAHLSRTGLVLDERGWGELSAALMGLFEHAEKIGKQSEERLKKANHEGERDASLVMMLFDNVPPHAASAPQKAPKAARLARLAE